MPYPATAMEQSEHRRNTRKGRTFSDLNVDYALILTLDNLISSDRACSFCSSSDRKHKWSWSRSLPGSWKWKCKTRWTNPSILQSIPRKSLHFLQTYPFLSKMVKLMYESIPRSSSLWLWNELLRKMMVFYSLFLLKDLHKTLSLVTSRLGRREYRAWGVAHRD